MTRERAQQLAEELVSRMTAGEKAAGRFEASVTIRNQGTRGTEEVLQLYIHDEESPFAPPNPILCGFKRVFLAAGEEKTVSVPIDEDAFFVVDDKGEHIPGSGRRILYAGFGGPDSRTQILTGRKALSVTIDL